MAKADFNKSLLRELVYEGGRSDDPLDPGGRTNRGVTQATYNSYRRKKALAVRDVYAIAAPEIQEIYQTLYWDKIDGDSLPVGLDLVVFDAAVNSGPVRAGVWLQQSLGDKYKGPVDGMVGIKTVQAIEDFADTDELIREYCERRMGTLRHLKNWRHAGKGWSARVANVQKIGCAWADATGSSEAPLSVVVTSLNGAHKAVVQDNLTVPPISAITAHIGTLASGTGAFASQAATQVQPLQDTFSWLKWVFGGLTLAAITAGFIAQAMTNASALADKGLAKKAVNPEADQGLPTRDILSLSRAVQPVAQGDVPATAPEAPAPAAPTEAQDPIAGIAGAVTAGEAP